MKHTILVCLVISAACTASAAADVLQVGPTRLYPSVMSAYAAAKTGDVIEIDSGTYYQGLGWVYVNGKNNLTFRGVGPTRPVLDAGNGSYQQKGIIVIETNASNITIENLELKNARLNAGNGSNAAGIRAQGTNLTVRNCYIHDCDDGVLNGAGDILFEYTEFYHNGYGDGQSHNIYISTANSFTMRYCYSHGAVSGHEVKTRAYNNYIYNNYVVSDGTGAREIQIAQGGVAYIIGNIVVQGANSSNREIVTYGGEGINTPAYLYVVGNTIVNQRVNGGDFLTISNVPTYALLQNNILQILGNGSQENTVVDNTGVSTVAQVTNWRGSNAGFVNATGNNYRLTSSSPAINYGSTPNPTINYASFPLVPTLQYKHSCNIESRPTNGVLDAGAYEYGTANQRPAVSAGTGQTVLYPNAASLSGTATDDGLPSSTLTTTWSLLNGPTGGIVTFGNSSALSTTASFSSSGNYVLQLQASDGVLSTTSTVTIIYDKAPIVNAGTDQTITSATLPATANLNGAASDPDNFPAYLEYLWTKVSGPGTVTFSSPDYYLTTATFNAYGTYVLQLDGMDGATTTSDTITIIVTAGNHAPTVNAGADIAAVYENLPVSLHATASDPDGDGLTYAWSQTAGQAVASPSGAATADYSFTAPVLTTRAGGAMTLRVDVGDGHGGLANDSVNVQVYMAGDSNHDWFVNVGDLQALVAAWGSSNTGSGGNWNASVDFNNDGFINVGDLQVLVANWGRNL